MCCKSISAIRPEDGAPMASPSCWMRVCFLCAKLFCLVMTSNQLSNSRCVWGAIEFCSRMLARITLVSFTGMLEYKLVMSNEVRL